MTPETISIARACYGYDAMAIRDVKAHLKAGGMRGELACLLFEAERADLRAAIYRSTPACKRTSKHRRTWDQWLGALKSLVSFLDGCSRQLDIHWGWQLYEDPRGPFWNLFIDLPTGQVFYSAPERLTDHQYEGRMEWGESNEIPIFEFCEEILAKASALPQAGRRITPRAPNPPGPRGLLKT